ncbi:MAG TPA: 1-deoxy-D-xylulose-5-phosphate synthase [Clostridiales bacterium]|nr:1-deoxy-D-xylulose-5-phosphate synthase [Clostridiales bacterium]
MYIDTITSPADIKNKTIDELNQLADEIRQLLIEVISQNGGHLASNLGVVELTLALHYVFDTPRDKIIWDVGHQTYVHKILTYRKDLFPSIRKYKGLSGFPKISESSHDFFNTGHSSTSISAALGFARARDLMGEDYSVLAVIGDGALTGGMALEGLNDAGHSPTNLIVILNDNQMSIANNVGSLSTYLSKIRSDPKYHKLKRDIEPLLNKIPFIGKGIYHAVKRLKNTIKYLFVPGIIFEELGFKYIGPVNGHDIFSLISMLDRARSVNGPVLIHVVTSKGKGYKHAELNPEKFHAVAPFNIKTGEELYKGRGITYSQVFGNTMLRLAKENEKIIAITAAMPHGTGLYEFSRLYPERFFDVGIAEQHAVTFAAGLAANGYKPVFAVYSTFLQRAYDQILHDVCIQNLPVVFAIDRCGLVGQDGETHHGIFDISYLSHIPNMTILSPSDGSELAAMLRYAVDHPGPVAIRYPKGAVCNIYKDNTITIEHGKWDTVRQGKTCCIMATGKMVDFALKSCEILEGMGIYCCLINCRFIKPLDIDKIRQCVKDFSKLVIIEDNTAIGGLGSTIIQELAKNGYKTLDVKHIAFPDSFVPHGEIDELLKVYNMDVKGLVDQIAAFVNKPEKKK